MSEITQRPGATDLFGHPKGLTILFLTETAAYFSAFGMQALLVLYMVQSLSFGQAKASMIFGLYVGCANLTPLLGGWIADRFIGQHRAVIAGALLMGAGHGVMIWDAGLYPGLGLVALGNGFFATSLVSRIGALYAAEDPRRDRAYMLYYLGINVGSFAAPLCCGWLAQHYGWHAGFGAAAIVMVLGLGLYLSCQALLPHGRDGDDPSAPSGDAGYQPHRNALLFLASVLALVVLFRLGYEQMGNSIALWIDRDVDRDLGGMLIPTPWFQSLNPLFIFLLSPVLALYWRRRDEGGRTIAPLAKMATGACFAGAAFLTLAAGAIGGASVPVGFVLGYFLLMTIAELHVFPIGLALIARFSSSRNRSTMIGLWYFVKFLASMAAGAFAALGGQVPPVTFFTANLALALAVAALMAILHRATRRSMGVFPAH